MDIELLSNLYLNAKQEATKKIYANEELIRLQMNMISFIVTSSIFDFNYLETRLDEIIFNEYILKNTSNGSDLRELDHFKEEVLRSGLIGFSEKAEIVKQILERHNITFKKGIFIDLAGLRNHIAHGLYNFDPDGKLGIEICLYGRKMEKIDFQELGDHFEKTKAKAIAELDRVYRELGLFVINDAEKNK